MQNNKPSTPDTEKVAKELESRLCDILETSRAASNIASSLGFIETVKNRPIKDNKPEVYDGFIQLMQEFHLRRIDLAGVTERAIQSFKDYPDLNKQFYEFIQPSKTRENEQDIQQALTEGGSHALTWSKNNPGGLQGYHYQPGRRYH